MTDLELDKENMSMLFSSQDCADMNLDSILDIFDCPLASNQLFNSIDVNYTNYTNEFPSSTCQVPCIENFPGELNFQTHIEVYQDCLYSTTLNKVFIKLEKRMPVHFKVDHWEPHLIVRALPVFLSPQMLAKPIKTCFPHNLENDPINRNFIQCEHPSVAYDTDEKSNRLSVCIPLVFSEKESDDVKVEYKFKCLSSCGGSIQRNRIGIIFTLERQSGEVIGRCVKEVKVCSCPKRDKEKEEKSIKNEKSELVQKTESELVQKTESENSTKIKFENLTEDTNYLKVKKSDVKRLLKFASDLIYRDIGKERREMTDYEHSLISYYENFS